jgi:ketosteroid isomerase-like protein
VSVSTQQLEEIVRERVEAVGRRDATTLLARHHPDVLTYAVLPPARTRGVGATAEALQAWFDGYAEGPGYWVHDLQVEADGDLGYCAFSYHVTGTLRSGDEVDMWVRATLVLRRHDGTWRVVHAHESVPFDPSTGAALLSEAPDGEGR